jgi:riboflavin biosynthesis pyrimidine reductase
VNVTFTRSSRINVTLTRNGVWWDGPVRRLLPAEPAETPDAGPLTDDDLVAAYAVPRGPAPYVRANFITSADGAASLNGRSGGLSTPADRRLFALLRDMADVILVGAGTARVERYRPAEADEVRRARRRSLGLAPLPRIAVVSGRLDLDPASPLFAPDKLRTIVVTHRSAPEDRRAALAEVADVIVAGDDAVDITAAIDELAARKLTRVSCEGGPTLLRTVLAAQRLDELCLTIVPTLVGAASHRLTAGPIADPSNLTVRHLLEEDGALFLRYLTADVSV